MCVQIAFDYTDSPYDPDETYGTYAFSGMFGYVPTANVTKGAPMVAASWKDVEKATVFPGVVGNVTYQTYYQYTYNYTFVATGVDGGPVVLFLDDVVYNAWHSSGV